MASQPTQRRVAGIDAGGSRKGFHAVALKDGRYLGRLQTRRAPELVRWCREEIGARVVAVDAPCRWSKDAAGRAAERELLALGIRCFLTPTRDEALGHPGGYYDWMCRGAALFKALEKYYPLAKGVPRTAGRRCFETFPHAITWNLRGGNAQAVRKRSQRLALLRAHGCRTGALTNMDWIDAAICALAADMFLAGRSMSCHGNPRTGCIIVPSIKRRP